MDDAELSATLKVVEDALAELTAPYVPPPIEAEHLDAALRHLITAYRGRDFEPGEVAVWNCHGITIAGEFAGEWEVTLRQTDCDSDTRAKHGDKGTLGSASGE